MSIIPSPYPIIYAFGDSLSDAGDAYLLTTSSYAAALGQPSDPVSPPYFHETYGTTGANVFSNGPVWVQLLAQSLGDPTPAPGEIGIRADTLRNVLAGQGLSTVAAALFVAGLEVAQHTSGPNPYLQIVAGAPGGTDFAIGGSVTGVTHENGGAAVPITDLAAQLGNFKASVATPVAAALYTVWSGANDLLTLLQDPSLAALTAAGAVAADIARCGGQRGRGRHQLGGGRRTVGAGAQRSRSRQSAGAGAAGDGSRFGCFHLDSNLQSRARLRPAQHELRRGPRDVGGYLWDH